MAQFKRSIQPTGFRPEEVSERNVSELQNYSNRIIGALKEERDAVITNRNEIANAMKENAQIEAQQASTNQQIQQQNVTSQIKAQQDLSTRALEEYETKTKTTKALYTTVSDLSLTASKKLREIEIKKFEEKDKAIAAEIYALGDNHPAVKALKALKYDSHIEEIDAKTKVAQARVQGADTLSADEALKQLNELGYTSKTAILRHVGRGWASYLRDQTISDKTYTDPTTGRTFTTKEAKEDQRLALILANEELAQYERIHGIAGQLSALKQESGYLDDTFKVTQTFADAVGKQQHETFIQKYLEDYSFKLGTMKTPAEAKSFHEREWSTLVSLLGRKGALDFLTESHKKVDTEGNSVYNLAALEAAELGPNGETFGVYWAKNRVADIKVALVQGRSAINKVTEEEKQLNALKDYRSVRKAVQAQLAAASAQDDESIFATVRKELADRNDGIVPKELEDDYQANLKQNKIEAENQKNIVLEKIRTGRATPGDVQSIADPELRQAVQVEYDKATKVRKFGENYESTLKKIKDGAKQIMGDSLEGSGSFEAFRLSLVMEKNFANDYAYALKVTQDPARALEIASNQLEKDINNAKQNVPGTRYHSESGPNNEKVFTGIRSLQAKTAAQKAEADKKLTSVISAKGINALTTPGLLGSESDLRSISEANKNNQLLRFTPQILKAAKLLGITELEATNQAIAAHNKVSPNKIPILTPDRNLQLVNNARPETRALFTNLPTRQSVLRGGAEIMQTPLRDPTNIRTNIRQFVSGNTGLSTAPHGDFRVKDLTTGQFIDPTPFLGRLTVKGKPLTQQFTMTSPFGMRTHPIHGDRRMHYGVDYGMPTGTLVDVDADFLERVYDPGGGGNMSIYTFTQNGRKYEMWALHGR